ncbi:GrpB family protein [Rhizobium jaguaris]|uniref:GrpB family protein n=1 Tax=Rhizobium jaguaris TaxID=1312183 RepID=A0A387FHS2_9HYPH|nr:GrpB family protein [Rhizobium jaguaris]AYG58850.1 GrpB family protein [Rhizobium jaguaris]
MRPITLVEYDPQWPLLFESRSKSIGLLLGHPAEFHHIGSTAVVGLCAKPKLDIDAVLSSKEARLDATERLKTNGYRFHGDLHGADRWTFTKDEAPYGTRLYLCLPGNEAHRERLLFCDYLRAHPEFAAGYAILKRRLAEEADGDWDHYTGGKSDFVADIVRRAKAALASAKDITTQ